MGDRKNIDRVFQETFKNFEAVPETHVWSAIEKKLGNHKRTPIIFPFILRYGGIAAAIALLITLEYHINPNHNAISNSKENISNTNNSKNIERNLTVPATTPVREVHTDHQTPFGSLDNTNPALVNSDHDNNDQEAVRNQRKSSLKNTIFISDHPVGENKETIAENYDRTSLGNIETISPTTIPIPSQKKYQSHSDSNALIENENEAEVVAESQESVELALKTLQDHKEDETASAIAANTLSNRWSISPNAAPIYFNSLENGSPIDRQFSDNKKSGNVTASYGINIAYQVSKRLSVRSGINRVSYGYNTDNIEFTGALQARSIDNISYNNTSQHITVTDTNVNSSFDAPTQSPVTASKPSVYEGKMVQEFGYLEVPLEIKYRLLNKKVGINLIGGLSSLFLTDNSISLQSDVVTTQIGTANNVNTMNFSTNIGLGVDYQVSDKMHFNLEPIFKYQLNTFSNDDGGFRPYTLGVYTGLSFRF